MFNKIYFMVMCIMAISSINLAQSKPFIISGTINGKTDAFIYMNYVNEATGNRVIDSAFIKDGKFTFKGKTEGPLMVVLISDLKSFSNDNTAQFYIEPGTMQLDIDNANFSQGKLTGSSVQKEADILNQMKKPVMDQLKPLSIAYKKANEEYIQARKAGKDEATLEQLKNKATEAKDKMDPYYDQLGKIDEDFMNKFPASYVTACLLRYRISSLTIQEGEKRFSKLPESIKNAGVGKGIKKELDGLRMGSPGAKAYMFSSKELRGDMLSLADFKGKYVLVDFWASWCVPCRKGNPHLLSLYSKYKDKGFEIIGISDDDSNPDAWKKAVEKDGIGVWKHILRGLKFDGKDFDRTNDISVHFGIHTLPTKVLIDPQGVIIGRYGGGGENDEAMDKKLVEIFGE